jgi:methionyl-tRNA formyltransferase
VKLLVFSLGIKGLSVVKGLFESAAEPSIFCVIGQDSAIADDYSAKLVAYCDTNSIDYSFRGFDYSAADYDFVFAVGWRWIIRDVEEGQLIVFHDSLLPRYRGFAPLVNALLNRERVIGVSALFGASEYDCGNIIGQICMDVSYPTSIGSELGRISNLYSELAVSVLSELAKGGVVGVPQDERAATYSLWRDDRDYKINWGDAASEIEHFINCVGSPYLGAASELNGEVVRIVRARVVEDVKIENRSPGKVIFARDGLPVVVCGKGLLMIEDARDCEGGSLLPLKSFRSRFL